MAKRTKIDYSKIKYRYLYGDKEMSLDEAMKKVNERIREQSKNKKQSA
jgi:hypothetical protein